MNRNITIVRDITHEQWLEERRKGIGSSEAGTLMGVNHFQTPYMLWRLKTGLDKPQEETEAMAMGHIHEEAVAKRFAMVTGAEIVPGSAPDWLAYDNDHPWRRVSPDRLYYDKGEKHTPKNWCIVECKTTSQEIDPLNVPLYWQYQLQYQMGVLGVSRGSIAWTSTAFRLHSGFQCFRFDPDIFARIAEKVDAFWKDNILGGRAPEFTTLEDVNAHFPRSVKKSTVTASAETEAAVRDLTAVKKQMDELEKRKSDLEMAVKTAMGDAEVLVGADGSKLASWSTCEGRSSFNTSAFKAENEELYRKYYVKGNPYRTLKIK